MNNCKPRTEPKEETKHANTLILDFSLQACEKINWYFLSHQHV